MVKGLTYRDAASQRVLMPDARAKLPQGASPEALRALGVSVAWETMSKYVVGGGVRALRVSTLRF